MLRAWISRVLLALLVNVPSMWSLESCRAFYTKFSPNASAMLKGIYGILVVCISLFGRLSSIKVLAVCVILVKGLYAWSQFDVLREVIAYCIVVLAVLICSNRCVSLLIIRLFAACANFEFMIETACFVSAVLRNCALFQQWRKCVCASISRIL